jgi:uncharacterized integral membrane protein
MTKSAECRDARKADCKPIRAESGQPLAKQEKIGDPDCMVRIIVSMLLLVLLAVLVSFNLGFTTSVSLFGAKFDQVPVMAVALLSFATGVLYSLFLYIGRFLHTRKREDLARRDKEISERERKLAERESEASQAAETAAEQEAAAPPESAETSNPPRTWRARFSRFFNPDR